MFFGVFELLVFFIPSIGEMQNGSNEFIDPVSRRCDKFIGVAVAAEGFRQALASLFASLLFLASLFLLQLPLLVPQQTFDRPLRKRHASPCGRGLELLPNRVWHAANLSARIVASGRPHHAVTCKEST
jgi:hypothetical protein